MGIRPGRVATAAVVLALTMGAASGPLPGQVASAITAQERASPGEVVVLVHGLGRTRLSMELMERALEREGYRVLNWGYSSTCCGIAELGTRLAEALRDLEATRPERVHFVGHSLGNLVIRWALANAPPDLPLGRMVMLAPPNRGAEAADRFTPYLGWLLDPLPELRTGAGGIAATLPPPSVETGVIAGAYDAKVSVAETRIDGIADHVVVPSAHTFVMNRRDAQRHTVRFLRTGRF
jgi:pimeloyl-ACP methyl ester carboxylesterase